MKCDCLLYPSQKATCDCHEEVGEPFNLGIEEMELRKDLEKLVDSWQEDIDWWEERKAEYEASGDKMMADTVEAIIKKAKTYVSDVNIIL